MGKGHINKANIGSKEIALAVSLLRSVHQIQLETEQSILGAHEYQKLSSGQVIESRGQVGKLYVILDGLVEKSVDPSNGRRYVQSIYSANEVIVQLSEIEPSHIELNYKSITSAQIIVIDIDSVLSHLSEPGDFYTLLFKLLVKNTAQVVEKDIRQACENLGPNIHRFSKQKPHVSQSVSNRKLAEYFAVTEQGFYKAKSKVAFDSDKEKYIRNSKLEISSKN